MNFNEYLIANIGLRFQRVMLHLGVFFGRQFTAAEGAFQVAVILAVSLMSAGYAIAWTSWQMSSQVSVIAGFSALIIGAVVGVVLMVRGQLTAGVVTLGAGLILGLTLIFQGGVLAGETIITLGGLFGAMFLMLAMAQLGVIGAEAAALAAGVDQASRPLPGPTFEFSEHLSGAQVVRILKIVSAVCATLVLMGMYSSVVPVYTSLKGFLFVLLTLSFFMLAAFGWANDVIWLPRLQRLSMFIAVVAVILYTIQFFANAAGVNVWGFVFPFGWVSTDPDILKGVGRFVSYLGLQEVWKGRLAWLVWATTNLVWICLLAVVLGTLVPWLLRATGIIEKPVRSSEASTSSSKGGTSATTALKLVVGLVVVFLVGSWLVAGASWMIENARPENNQDTRSSVVQPSRSEVPQPVKAAELPVRWQTLGSFSLQPNSDWQETGLTFEPNDCVSFELTGWSGTVNVQFDDKHMPIEVAQGGKITLIQKGELKMKVFSVESGKNAGYSVIVRKRVIG